jgi:hypothetical protein
MAGYQDPLKKCLVSGKLGVDLHHVKHRGAGGSDEEFNLMPLSRAAHQELHKIGLTTFAEKYSQVKKWLLNNNWQFNTLMKKWLH